MFICLFPVNVGLRVHHCVMWPPSCGAKGLSGQTYGKHPSSVRRKPDPSCYSRVFKFNMTFLKFRGDFFDPNSVSPHLADRENGKCPQMPGPKRLKEAEWRVSPRARWRFTTPCVQRPWWHPSGGPSPQHFLSEKWQSHSGKLPLSSRLARLQRHQSS